jgi:hypothetical protein
LDGRGLTSILALARNSLARCLLQEVASSSHTGSKLRRWIRNGSPATWRPSLHASNASDVPPVNLLPRLPSKNPREPPAPPGRWLTFFWRLRRGGKGSVREPASGRGNALTSALKEVGEERQAARCGRAQTQLLVPADHPCRYPSLDLPGVDVDRRWECTCHMPDPLLGS